MWMRIFSKLALVALSITTTLVGVELVLRSGVLAGSPFRSTAVETQSNTRPAHPDLRTRRYDLETRSDRRRILVVGDSFAWGGGIHPEDAFPDRLETRLRYLRARADPEVINWSRPGWNTVLEERSLRENFDKLDPNLLIVGFVLNDAEPSGVAEVEALRYDLARRDPRRGGMKFLFERSRLFALIWNRIENTRQRRALTTYYLELYEGDDWRHCQGALRRMRNLARDRDVPMLLVILPIFDSPLDDRYPYQDLHRLISETAEKLKIPVLDLWPTFRDLETRRLAVEPFTDAHPNELANRIITDAIVRYLRRKDLVRIPRQRPG